MDGICITLDCAQAEFLTSDRAVEKLNVDDVAYIVSLEFEFKK